MRQGSRETSDSAELIHHLNQRYRQEFDRAERLRAELVAIQGSRLWPWFCRLRGWARRCRGIFGRGEATTNGEPGRWCRPFEPAPGEPLRPGQVSIIIPFRDQAELLSRCLASLRRTAAEAEVVLVDNGSAEPRTKSVLREWQPAGNVTIVRRDEPFNFSRLCNAGAREAGREALLFLNNDVMASQPDWLQAMLDVLADPRVGVVGATLLYPDRTLQHVGLAPTGRDGAWEHPYRFYPESLAGEHGELRQIRSAPAVTGACLMIRRALFDRLGGFDECHAVTMNDVDLCRRVREAGLEVVVTPHARLWHFESLSRGYQRESA